MLTLTRETRLSINASPADQRQPTRSNGYAGHPSLIGIGHYFALRQTLTGQLDPASNYLVNIKQMDAVAAAALPLLESACYGDPAAARRTSSLIAAIFERLNPHWTNGITLEEVSLSLSPFLIISCLASEHPMTRLSQKFEFAASHRLHNPALSDEENKRTYGKCNNPFGHGHNYEVQVTLAGQPDASGLLIHVPDFERIVSQTVIEKLDHKNLNAQVDEFKDLIPSVENIARVIYKLLKTELGDERVRLASVTVWETPKTWCEYSE